MAQGKCFKCGVHHEFRDPVGFREECDRCRAELHTCRNCKYHDPTASNDCRENRAGRVVDKERGNLCDWFEWGGPGPGETDEVAQAKARLEAMFKK